MDWNALALFCEAYERGSFSAAARHIGTSPSQVSRQIVALEAALGLRLFQRSTRKLSPTDAGRRYFLRVRPLLQALDSAHETLRGDAEVVAGVVRVATSGPFAERYVVPWAIALRQRYPQLAIELLLAAEPRDLIADQVDVALRLGSAQDSSVVGLRVASMPRVMVASPRYLEGRTPIAAPRDLLQHDCLIFPFANGGHRWLLRGADARVQEVEVRATLSVADASVLRAHALAAGGVTILPRWLVRDDLSSGALVSLLPELEPTATGRHDAGLWLMYPSRHHVPARVRVFTEFVKAQFPNGLLA